MGAAICPPTLFQSEDNEADRRAATSDAFGTTSIDDGSPFRVPFSTLRVPPCCLPIGDFKKTVKGFGC